MAFQIIEQVDLTILRGTALGVSIDSFRPIYLSIDQAIENVKNLLLTRKGERIIHTEYGSDLLKIIFEPNVSELKSAIKEIITDPIVYWLPYINIDNIDIETADDNTLLPHNIKITITISLNEIETGTITFTADDSGQLGVE